MKARHIFPWALTALVAPVLLAPVSAQPSQAKVDAKAPTADPLPRPPQVAPPIVLPGKLTLVPEVEFQAREGRKAEDGAVVQALEEQVVKIKAVNATGPDTFVRLLRERRSDLRGLPFQMGESCRMGLPRWRSFSQALEALRKSSPDSEAEAFWRRYGAALSEQDRNHLPDFLADRSIVALRRARQDAVAPARVATLMQVLAPESAQLREGLVAYLAGVPHPDASRSLAKLAVFSQEKDLRDAALRALKGRRERDYTEVLTQGLRYPWPPVAERAAEAITKLGRTDLVPKLVGLLDQPDPRRPVRAGKSEVVRELVRINHHRNCLLCHAPGSAASRGDNATAPIPLPTRPLSGGYYTQPVPDLVVRIDVTYLRQDFSRMLPVAHSDPWPKMQRFDFLVRTRAVNKREAEALRAALDQQRGREGTSPYDRAILRALRALRRGVAEQTH